MHFMQQMESKMKQVEQEILAGRRRPIWSATVELPYSVGYGKMLIGSQIVDVKGITSVRLAFEYDNGVWYEKSAFPNARHHLSQTPLTKG